MKASLPCTFSWIYQTYLEWFSGRARPGAVPRQEEEIAGASCYSEEIFDNGHVVLNRVVYYVPLKASEAISGVPEMFGFTELNLMEANPDGDIEEITPVEYALL